MTCVQGFICAVPTAHRDMFIEHAKAASEAFRDHGCLAAVECWGDDVPIGEVTSFPRAVLAGRDETVVFSWYVWPSKVAHDMIMNAPPDDPRLNPKTNPMPFDGKRVIFGAFEPVLELGTYRPGGYVDGFVLAIPKARRAAFIAFAKTCDPVFMEYGASWIMENWSIDLPDGKLTDFRRAVQAQPDEDIVFSWVQWPDKASRDAGNQKIMADPRLAGLDMPFDGKRIIFGGFLPVVEIC
ncbi:MAG: DUF1428 domain-containing protein [Rhodobacteraceae bacterium]|nr:DUF1428 domain-containing protein [Paracoccaceae bacterium]